MACIRAVSHSGGYTARTKREREDPGKARQPENERHAVAGDKNRALNNLEVERKDGY